MKKPVISGILTGETKQAVMKNLRPRQIAWLIPFAYLFHLADEYFSGGGFHNWFSGSFNVDLSILDFIIINSVGFTATIILIIFYNAEKLNHFVIAVLGTLFFVNGIVHFLASLFTASYSPGTITGVLLYLPIGFLVFKRIFPLVPEEQRKLSVIAGIILQLIVAVIALSV